MYTEALQAQINLLQQENAQLKQQLAASTRDFSATIARLEQELSESQNLLPFFDISVDLLCIASFDGYFLRINPAGEKILGYSQAELRSLPFLELVYPEDRANTLAEMSKLSQGIRVFRFENRYRRKDGSYCWLSWTSVAHDNCIFAMARDVSESKATEEALKQFETKIKFLLQQTPLGIIEWNPAFEVVEWNPAAEKIFGYSAAEMLHQHALEIVPENQRNVVVEIMKSLLEQKGSNHHLNENITKKGKSITCEWINTLLLDAKGDCLGIYSIVQDVSDRLNFEAMLRQQEAQYRGIFETVNDGISVMDLETGKIVAVNPAFCEMHGYSQTEFLKLNPTDYIHANSFEKFGDFIKTVKAGQKYHTQAVGIRKDGTSFDIEVTGKLFEYNGKPHAISVLRDISERIEAEQEQQRLLAILEATPDIVGITDVCGQNCYLNKAGQKMLGISSTDQFPISEAVGLSMLEKFQTEIIPIVMQQGIWSGESLMRSRNGEEFPVSQVIIAHKNEQGEVEFLSTIARDISDRQQIEVQLRQQAQDLEATLQELQRTQTQMIQAEKMSSLGQLVAGVAHEINNPVNFIHGNVNYLEEHTQDLLRMVQLYQQKNTNFDIELQTLHEEIDLEYIQQDLPKILSSMKVGTQRIRQIVLSLRTFSRMDEAEFKAVDIHAGIDSTLMILQHRLKEQPERPAIQVIKEYGTLPLVECYAGQLNQVFMNILANAVDALEESFVSCQLSVVNGQVRDQGQLTADLPSIRISTSVSSSNRIKIAIADNGMGMPEKTQQQVFNPFFTTKPVGKGTGMGMSISYQIITEKHNGKLECYSKPGKGTEFIIEIPIQQ